MLPITQRSITFGRADTCLHVILLIFLTLQSLLPGPQLVQPNVQNSFRILICATVTQTVLFCGTSIEACRLSLATKCYSTISKSSDRFVWIRSDAHRVHCAAKKESGNQTF